MRSKTAGQSGIAKPFSAPSILFVDDNPDILALFAALLASTGYCMTVCNGPADALNLASSTDFDVLVTDFDMPTMNGLALASAVSAGNLNLGVVLTSATAEDLPTAYIASRGWDLIDKPIDPVRLVSAIESQFRKRHMSLQTPDGQHTASHARKPVRPQTNAVTPLARIA